MRTRNKWLIGLGVVGVIVAGLGIYAFREAKRLSQEWEPMARRQLVEYLEKRFDSSVEIGKLDFQVPMLSPMEIWRHGFKGRTIKVWGENFKLRWKRRTDFPPMIEFRKVTFEADIGSLYEGPKIIELVTLEGLRIVMPPKGVRPSTGVKKDDSRVGKKDPVPETPQTPQVDEKLVAGQAPEKQAEPGIVFRKIVADGAFLQILPGNPKKLPLDFELHKLTLISQGSGKPLAFATEMTNPTPPGLIISNGFFGPWVKEDPRQSAVEGVYKFENADLGVFKGIGGILHSTGKYSGVIEKVNAEGECRVPDFRLTMSGNKVPLKVNYKALVDGTDGDTYLRPVTAMIGKTPMTASGEVVHIEGQRGRSIVLDVAIKQGYIEDMLRLAMKGTGGFLTGRFDMKTKLDLPPGQGDVPKRLKLKGNFELKEANFTSSAVEDKIDSLSKRGQGKPQDATIDKVPATFAGNFDMRDGRIDFIPVMFAVPGANVDLNGYYLTETAAIDFRGSLRLDAKVSDTFSGWKKIALKPLNPIFNKNGAGTFLRIAITGDKDNVKFGLDRKGGGKDKEEKEAKEVKK